MSKNIKPDISTQRIEMWHIVKSTIYSVNWKDSCFRLNGYIGVVNRKSYIDMLFTKQLNFITYIDNKKNMLLF